MPYVSLQLADFSDSDKERFWAKVNKDGPVQPHMLTKCWLWTGNLLQGYGDFRGIGGRRHSKAHRVSFFLCGSVTTDAKPCVLHACHVRNCVNPSHLRAGDRSDNATDMIMAGRSAKGDKSGVRKHPEKLRRGTNRKNAVLTEEIVYQMRRRFKDGESQSSLAVEFGVHQSTANRAILGVKWSHVS